VVTEPIADLQLTFAQKSVGMGFRSRVINVSVRWLLWSLTSARKATPRITDSVYSSSGSWVRRQMWPNGQRQIPIDQRYLIHNNTIGNQLFIHPIPFDALCTKPCVRDSHRHMACREITFTIAPRPARRDTVAHYERPPIFVLPEVSVALAAQETNK
jgi:hypothetical protein